MRSGEIDTGVPSRRRRVGPNRETARTGAPGRGAITVSIRPSFSEVVLESPIASLGKGLRCEFVDAYGDGTVNARIIDDQGHQAVICIDGRKGSPTRYRLFEGDRHPNRPGAVLIELGAPEEGIVVPLLSRWLDSDEARKSFTEEGYERVRMTVSRLGEPTLE